MEHDLEYNIYINNEKLYYSKAITDGVNIFGIDERTILTKAQFLACFKEWISKEDLLKILNEKGEDTDA